MGINLGRLIQQTFSSDRHRRRTAPCRFSSFSAGALRIVKGLPRVHPCPRRWHCCRCHCRSWSVPAQAGSVGTSSCFSFARPSSHNSLGLSQQAHARRRSRRHRQAQDNRDEAGDFFFVSRKKRKKGDVSVDTKRRPHGDNSRKYTRPRADELSLSTV